MCQAAWHTVPTAAVMDVPRRYSRAPPGVMVEEAKLRAREFLQATPSLVLTIFTISWSQFSEGKIGLCPRDHGLTAWTVTEQRLVGHGGLG